MENPIKKYMFREVGSMWRNISGDSELLCDILQLYEIIIDDRTQFARLYDYDKNICIKYRRYGGTITIDIWEIQND